MITLLVLILLLLVLNTTILLIHIEDKPDREIHPVAIEAVRTATKLTAKLTCAECKRTCTEDRSPMARGANICLACWDIAHKEGRVGRGSAPQHMEGY